MAPWSIKACLLVPRWFQMILLLDISASILEQRQDRGWGTKLWIQLLKYCIHSIQCLPGWEGLWAERWTSQDRHFYCQYLFLNTYCKSQPNSQRKHNGFISENMWKGWVWWPAPVLLPAVGEAGEGRSLETRSLRLASAYQRLTLRNSSLKTI